MNLELDYQAWMSDAICPSVGTDLFFPERATSAAQPRRICDRCPVATQCLEYALDHHEDFGIWGGKSPKQREAIRRARAA